MPSALYRLFRRTPVRVVRLAAPCSVEASVALTFRRVIWWRRSASRSGTLRRELLGRRPSSSGSTPGTFSRRGSGWRDHGDAHRPADGGPLRRRRDRQPQLPYAGALGEVHKRDLTRRHPEAPVAVLASYAYRDDGHIPVRWRAGDARDSKLRRRRGGAGALRAAPLAASGSAGLLLLVAAERGDGPRRLQGRRHPVREAGGGRRGWTEAAIQPVEAGQLHRQHNEGLPLQRPHKGGSDGEPGERERRPLSAVQDRGPCRVHLRRTHARKAGDRGPARAPGDRDAWPRRPHRGGERGYGPPSP